MLNTPALIRYHAMMLHDSARTEAFRAAIERVVRPGDVVCDIGAGSGILSVFAARAGARRVYAIEEGPMAEVARLVAAANGGGAIDVLHGKSTELELPEPADVLVSETLWNAGVGEGIVRTLQDARERLARPRARIVPADVEVLVAPVESAAAYSVVDAWSEDRYGTDLSGARDSAVNSVHLQHLAAEELLAERRPAARIDLTAPYGGPARGSPAFVASRPGTLHGLGAWFRSRLAPEVTIENHPGSSLRSWQQAFLPLGSPVEIGGGEPIEVEVRLDPEAEEWHWTVVAAGREQAQATALGRLGLLEYLAAGKGKEPGTPGSLTT